MKFCNLIASACTLTLCLAGLSAPTLAQQVQDYDSVRLEEWSVFHGLPGGYGSVARYEIHTGRALRPSQALTDLRWLPIEVIGRDQSQLGDPNFPQVHADLPLGMTRVELPHHRGGLYHFERIQADGSRAFGYLYVPMRGRARIVFETRGLAGNFDPLLPRIAIHPDGTRFLAGTYWLAGGDLWEVPLESGRPILRTANHPRLRIGVNSMGLSEDWGFAVTAEGVLRFDLGAASDAEFVPVANPNVVYWKGEAAMSSDRRAAIVIGGFDPDNLFPFALTRTGGLEQAHTVPQVIRAAGFLPDHPGGPFLSISNDGRHLAWTANVPDPDPLNLLGYSGEVMVANLNALAPAVEASGDAVIIDTLEEVGRLRHFGVKLSYAIGERNDITEGGLESADFFEAGIDDQGVFQMLNRTGTMGDFSVPFDTGLPTLVPEQVVHLTSGRSVIFDGESEQFYVADLQNGGLTPIHSDVKEVQWIRSSGDWALAAFERRSGNRPFELWRFSMLNPGIGFVVDSGSPLHRFENPTRLSSGAFGLRTVVGLNESIRHVHPDTGQVSTWVGVGNQFTTPLLAAQSDYLGFSPTNGGTSEQVLWSSATQTEITLQHPSYPGHFLP